MEIRNIETGEPEFADYDTASAMVAAGTHEHINRGAGGEIKDDVAEKETAERRSAVGGFPLPSGATVEPSSGSAPAPAGGDGENNDDLDNLSKDELVARAKERGIEVKAGDTKADIIEKLKA